MELCVAIKTLKCYITELQSYMLSFLFLRSTQKKINFCADFENKFDVVLQHCCCYNMDFIPIMP